MMRYWPLLLLAACTPDTREVESDDSPPAATVAAVRHDTLPVVVSRSPTETAILDSAVADSSVREVRFRFRNDRLPSIRVAYADEPVVQCGSGDAIAVAGSAVLMVTFEPSDAHEFFGENAVVTVKDRNQLVSGEPLRQLTLTCDFEGQVIWALGLGSKVPFNLSVTADSAVVISF
jgi:hypothetical protein